MKTINEVFGKAIQECETRWAKEKLMKKEILELVDKEEIPYFMYREFKRIHYRPLVDPDSHYIVLRGHPYMSIGSCIMRYSDGNLRRMNTETLKKIRSLDNQIHEIEQLKEKVLNEAWVKAKKLSWQYAKDFDDKRQELLRKYQLIETSTGVKHNAF